MTRPTSSTPGDVLLPRPPGVLRRWVATHPRFIDGFIVGSYIFGCALVVTFDLIAGAVVGTQPGVAPEAAASLSDRSVYLTWPWLIISVLIIGLVALGLAYRRRFPLAGVVLVAVLMLLEQGLLMMPNSVALVFLLYAVPVFKSVRAGWIAFGVAFILNLISTQLTGGTGSGLVGPFGIALADGPASDNDQVVVSVANGLWLLVVLMIGINLGNRRRYVEALIDRAHQLAQEREQRARLAVVAERSRIAREMHDIVAHSLSVVVTLSEAAAVAIDTKPAAAKQALERSAETGRQALTEMRRLLGVLNEEESIGSAGVAGAESSVAQIAYAPHVAYAPQPGLAQLPELIASFTDAGLQITFTQEGVSQGDSTHQLAVYRVVQEGLTNVLRHSGPHTDVELYIVQTTDVAVASATRIEVLDSGPKITHEEPRVAIPGTGRGLAGAAERVHMFGGVLESGPCGSGWRLVAVVPIGAESEPYVSEENKTSGGEA